MGGKEQDRKNNNKKNQVDESAIFSSEERD